jgi:hypothetical protein
MDYPKVSGSSAQLAALVIAAAGQVSPGLLPESYPLPGKQHDPAAFSSDHVSFYYHACPACLVAEDLYPDPGEPSSKKPKNPDYHTANDVEVNVSYAADVARAVAAAAWMIASSGPTPWRRTPPPPVRTGTSEGAETTDTARPVTIEVLSESTTTHEGSDPMPEKFLVEFLAKWIRDADFRCQVLHKELTTLQDWEMSGPQIQDLVSLDKARILDRVIKELEGLGIDLDQVRNEVNPAGLVLTGSGGTDGGSSGGLMSAATVYYEGQVHLRGVTPQTIGKDKTRHVVLRGQGFDASKQVQVKFEKGTTEVLREVIGISCDVDVYQRAIVEVTLNETGEWSVYAQNPGEPWSSEDVVLFVI